MIKPEWKGCKSILGIRLDNLGDVLMAQPALRALKESLPKSKLTLLTSSMGGGIAKLFPELDEVLIFDAPWVKQKKRGIGSGAVFEQARLLKEKKFDAAVIFTSFSQSSLPAAMLCYLAGIPRVLGYCRENPYRLITEWVPDSEPFAPIKHGVQRQLDLVKIIGATTKRTSLILPVSPKASRKVRDLLGELGLDLKRPWLTMHAGVSESKRQYPVRLFKEAARKIAEQLGLQVVLTGTEQERLITDKIASALPVYDVSKCLDLDGLTALLSQSRVLVSNNTGPVHMAAAVKTPVVVLYARTNPEHTPWQVDHRTLYFDVPEKIRSRNTLLAYSTPGEKKLFPTPDHIVQAVREILESVVLLPGEVSRWV